MIRVSLFLPPPTDRKRFSILQKIARKANLVMAIKEDSVMCHTEVQMYRRPL